MMSAKYGNILDTIGNTPIVPIRHLNANDKVTIVAKPESFNPGGSIKDRAALSMIEDAEHSGQLTKDKTIVEATRASPIPVLPLGKERTGRGLIK
jgi:cysteinyl-tRNA synthetase